MNRRRYLGLMFGSLAVAGCNATVEPGSEPVPTPDSRTVRIHIDGFKRSKSGSI